MNKRTIGITPPPDEVDFTKILKDSLTSQVVRWISVKEKYPEKDGRYLVWVPDWNWLGISSLRSGKFDDTLATHWMPLPELPKELE